MRVNALTHVRLRAKLACYSLPGNDDSNWENCSSLILFLAAVAVRPVAAQGRLPSFHPKQGDVLQGVVTIRGSSNETGFLSAEVDFAYAGDTTGTWFLIATGSQPVDSNILASWDTTTITDGNYNLRLRVTLTDGTHLRMPLSRICGCVITLRLKHPPRLRLPFSQPCTPTTTLRQLPFQLPLHCRPTRQC